MLFDKRYEILEDCFSYQRYKSFLETALKTCRIINFRDIKAKGYPFLKQLQRFLILRHDIDFSVEAAHKMAVLEYELGIKASYFFLFSDGYYNPIGRSERPLIEEIVGMGHDIGLHFDWSFIERNGKKDIHRLFKSQRSILERFIMFHFMR